MMAEAQAQACNVLSIQQDLDGVVYAVSYISF